MITRPEGLRNKRPLCGCEMIARPEGLRNKRPLCGCEMITRPRHCPLIVK
ncbi:MAG: hypothetical protein IIY92_05895 [Lachnospiraceae bacterium]|nr:hypothetical protein [Lachnospiraceae bacterium]